MWMSKDEVSSTPGSTCSLSILVNVQIRICFPVYVLLPIILVGQCYSYVKGGFTCLVCKLFFLVLCTTKF